MEGNSRRAVLAVERERGRGGFRAMDPLAQAMAPVLEDSAAGAAPFSLETHTSPDSTRVHWRHLRRALAQRSPGALGAAGWALARAAVLDPWVQLTLCVSAAVAACVAAWFAVLALTVYHAVARGRLLLHDYSDSFPARFRRVSPLAFGVFLAGVLWAAGAGPLLTLVLVGVVLTPYMELRPRLAFGVAVWVACWLPAAAGRVAAWAGDGADTAWLAYRVQRGDAGADLLQALRESPAGRTPRGLYLSARVARRNGEPKRAVEWLAAASAAASDPGLIANERGSLAFLAGDVPAAEELFRQARTARPRDPVPWLNQHLVALRKLDLDGADRALARARELDAELTERFEAVRSADPEALFPVSHRVPRGWVWAAYLAETGQTGARWSQGMTDALFLPGGVVSPLYVGGFGLLVALLAGYAGRERRSSPCPSCGFVVCPRCSRRVKGTLLCSACWSAANDRDVDTAEKERRGRSAARWAARQGAGRRLAHLLLPGWPDYVGAAPVRGGLVAVLWAGGAGTAVTAALFPLPLFAWGGPQLHWGIGAAPLLVAHLAGAWRALRSGPEG